MPRRKTKRKLEDKPLTLALLNRYNRKIFLPELEKRFVTKKEFKELKSDANTLKDDVNVLKEDVSILKIDLKELKNDASKLKKGFKKFKNESLTNQDSIIEKLKKLLDEKKVAEYQKEKEKKMWFIVINALKEHDILSQNELKEITKLGVF